jgi:hypothetical protein
MQIEAPRCASAACLSYADSAVGMHACGSELLPWMESLDRLLAAEAPGTVPRRPGYWASLPFPQDCASGHHVAAAARKRLAARKLRQENP